MERTITLHIRVVSSGPEDEFLVHMEESTLGRATHTFQMPFHPAEAEARLLRLTAREKPLRLEDPSERAIRTFGSELFDLLFQGPTKVLYRSALLIARSENRLLRVVIHAGSTGIAAVPWEYLYDSEHDLYPSLSSQTCLLRSVPGDGVPRDRASGCTRILALLASPEVDRPIELDAERQRLATRLADPISDGEALLEFVPNGTLSALRSKLAQGRFDVFYFVGHGTFDRKHDDGLLAFETASRQRHQVPGRQLATLLQGQGIQLAVLNSCEGAQSSPHDRFAGVSSALHAKGIAASVAMQFEIESVAALEFGSTFLEAYVRLGSLERAMTNARQSIYAMPNGGVEWGTPILQLSDSRYFCSSIDDVGNRRRSILVWAAAASLVALSLLLTLQSTNIARSIGRNASTSDNLVAAPITSEPADTSQPSHTTQATNTPTPTASTAPAPATFTADAVTPEPSATPRLTSTPAVNELLLADWPTGTRDSNSAIYMLAGCCGGAIPSWLNCVPGWCIGGIEDSARVGIWSSNGIGASYEGSVDANRVPFEVLSAAGSEVGFGVDTVRLMLEIDREDDLGG